MKNTRWVALMLGALALQSLPKAQAETLAIVGATLVSPQLPAPVGNSALLISDGRIVAAGSAASVRIPRGTRTIAAAGKWIVPGYIDSHVHFFQSGGLFTRPDMIDLRSVVPYEGEELPNIRKNLHDTFERFLRSGVTSVMDVGGPMWNLEVRRIAEQTAKAPRVSVAGPLLASWCPPETKTGDPPIIVVSTPEEARSLVRREVAAGVDLIKLWVLGPDDLDGLTIEGQLPWIRAAIDEAHSAGLRVAAHATYLEVARAVVEAGADVLVHGVTDRPVDAAFLELLRRKRTIYTTSAVIWESLAEVMSHQVRLTPAELELGNPHVIGTLLEAANYPASYQPDDARALMDTVRMTQGNLRKVLDAGVTIALGTDAGNIGTLPGPSVFREMELMAEAGLSSREILRIATLGGAQLLGRARDLGTLERGKLADMVVLNGDPLADVRNASDIAAVVKNGQWFDADQLAAPTPADVVQRQVNAYNLHDLDAFLVTYAADARIYDLHGKLELEGTSALRAQYGHSDHMSSSVSIRHRAVLGDLVVDYEAKSDPPGFEAVVIYRVQAGKIQEVRIVR